MTNKRFLCNLFLLILNSIASFAYSSAYPPEKPPGIYKKLRIKWVTNLPGNFSFKDSWSYPIGVYHNIFGQLSRDGLCPERVYNMKDSTGRIPDDSLKTLYTILDTTHQFHSIESEAWAYEWAGTNYLTAKKQKNLIATPKLDCTSVVPKTPDTIYCYTATTPATHSSLKLMIIGDSVIPYIELNSIRSIRTHEGFTNTFFYPCKGGTITLDKNLWQMGILKAKFDFIFEHPENPEKPMYWKGNIYTKIF